MSSQNAITFLKEIISHIHYGIKTPAGISHCNTADRILSAYNSRQSYLRIYLHRLPNADIASHQSGEQTYYFNGAWRFSDEYTLAMIDIDCQKKLRMGSCA